MDKVDSWKVLKNYHQIANTLEWLRGICRFLPSSFGRLKWERYARRSTLSRECVGVRQKGGRTLSLPTGHNLTFSVLMIILSFFFSAIYCVTTLCLKRLTFHASELGKYLKWFKQSGAPVIMISEVGCTVVKNIPSSRPLTHPKMKSSSPGIEKNL